MPFAGFNRLLKATVGLQKAVAKLHYQSVVIIRMTHVGKTSWPPYDAVVTVVHILFLNLLSSS